MNLNEYWTLKNLHWPTVTLTDYNTSMKIVGKRVLLFSEVESLKYLHLILLAALGSKRMENSQLDFGFKNPSFLATRGYSYLLVGQNV